MSDEYSRLLTALGLPDVAVVFDPADADAAICSSLPYDGPRPPGAVEDKCHDCNRGIICCPKSLQIKIRVCMSCGTDRARSGNDLN